MDELQKSANKEILENHKKIKLAKEAYKLKKDEEEQLAKKQDELEDQVRQFRKNLSIWHSARYEEINEKFNIPEDI